MVHGVKTCTLKDIRCSERLLKGSFCSIEQHNVLMHGLYNTMHLMTKYTVYYTVQISSISNCITALTIIIYLYILAVFPSSSGIAISGAVTGYVTVICHGKTGGVQITNHHKLLRGGGIYTVQYII